MSFDHAQELNQMYVDTFGNKMLDEVISDFVDDKYSFQQLLFYLEWNGFETTDIDMPKIKDAQSKRREEKCGQQMTLNLPLTT